MAKREQTEEQKRIVGRVMQEFKDGALRSSSGDKVENPKQAIAIALSEAGDSNQQTPAQNRRALRRTRARGAVGPSRDELYARAKAQNIKGRSTMSKAELQTALGSPAQ